MTNVQEALDALIAVCRDEHHAFTALVERIGYAVNYQCRETFEGHLHRPMTDDEWSRVSPLLDGYDEWMDNSGAAESMSYWRGKVLDEAGVVDAECPECLRYGGHETDCSLGGGS